MFTLKTIANSFSKRLREFPHVSRTGFRYLLTRLEDDEPTIASLQQTIEDIKAVLAASDIPVAEGLAELHQSGTFKIAAEDVSGRRIETILMARGESVRRAGSTTSHEASGRLPM